MMSHFSIEVPRCISLGFRGCKIKYLSQNIRTWKVYFSISSEVTEHPLINYCICLTYRPSSPMISSFLTYRFYVGYLLDPLSINVSFYDKLLFLVAPIISLFLSCRLYIGDLFDPLSTNVFPMINYCFPQLILWYL